MLLDFVNSRRKDSILRYVVVHSVTDFECSLQWNSKNRRVNQQSRQITDTALSAEVGEEKSKY